MSFNVNDQQFTIYTYYMHILPFWLYPKLPFLLRKKYENKCSENVVV